jgi:uncharacterized protein (TIGR02246 family)
VTDAATELEALERRGWEALSSSDGAAFYREVMADDGLMVFPGAVLDKDASLRAIESSAPWATFTLADVRVVAPTADTGIVAYQAIALRSGEREYRAAMTSHYARRDGTWRLLLHQQSPAAPRP